MTSINDNIKTSPKSLRLALPLVLLAAILLSEKYLLHSGQNNNSKALTLEDTNSQNDTKRIISFLPMELINMAEKDENYVAGIFHDLNVYRQPKRSDSNALEHWYVFNTADSIKKYQQKVVTSTKYPNRIFYSISNKADYEKLWDTLGYFAPSEISPDFPEYNNSPLRIVGNCIFAKAGFDMKYEGYVTVIATIESVNNLKAKIADTYSAADSDFKSPPFTFSDLETLYKTPADERRTFIESISFRFSKIMDNIEYGNSIQFERQTYSNNSKHNVNNERLSLFENGDIIFVCDEQQVFDELREGIHRHYNMTSNYPEELDVHMWMNTFYIFDIQKNENSTSYRVCALKSDHALARKLLKR